MIPSSSSSSSPLQAFMAQHIVPRIIDGNDAILQVDNAKTHQPPARKPAMQGDRNPCRWSKHPAEVNDAFASSSLTSSSSMASTSNSSSDLAMPPPVRTLTPPAVYYDDTTTDVIHSDSPIRPTRKISPPLVGLLDVGGTNVWEESTTSTNSREAAPRIPLRRMTPPPIKVVRNSSKEEEDSRRRQRQRRRSKGKQDKAAAMDLLHHVTLHSPTKNNTERTAQQQQQGEYTSTRQVLTQCLQVAQETDVS